MFDESGECLGGKLDVVEVAPLRAGGGQLVLEVQRCGICGSDLHAKDHADELDDVMTDVGYRDFIRSDTPVVMGHDSAARSPSAAVVSPRSSRSGRGRVLPAAARQRGCAHDRALAAGRGGLCRSGSGGGVDEFRRAQRPFPDVAALTEPMAVALHAVRRSEIGKRDVAIVVGCGPVGLAVICHLKALGVRTIVASDFSAGRRALAGRCGADVVVDPAAESPMPPDPRKGVIDDAPASTRWR